MTPGPPEVDDRMNGSGHHGATGWSGTLAGHDPEPEVAGRVGDRMAPHAVQEQVPGERADFVVGAATVVRAGVRCKGMS